MKKVIAKHSKTGEILPVFSTTKEPEKFIKEAIENEYWGKAERDVPISADYDAEDVIEEFDHVMTPAIDEVVNESGEVVQEAIPAVLVKMVKLRAEYIIEILDVSAEADLAECIAKRKAEYPTPEEFMNAWFDGGESGLNSLHAKRLEIKAKYPKP
jgi:hypothetical protein